MAECDKVCKYIDLPLQHASNSGPEADEAARNAPEVRRAPAPGFATGCPGVALRTTFIVGFPGETEADVEELATFVEEQRFDHVGVFTYSHEEGTSAFALEDDVPAPEKQARRRAVMALQKRLVGAANAAGIGEIARILVDGPSGDHDLVLKGRLMTQAPDIDAAVYLTDCDPSSLRAGDFAEVEIVGARDYDLIARPIPGLKSLCYNFSFGAWVEDRSGRVPTFFV